MTTKIKYDLIRKPIITEKSAIIGEHGKYVFRVSPSSNKPSIKKAIEEILLSKRCKCSESEG
jgi:large subunit ribosomal protein L23